MNPPKFLIDECLSPALARRLVERGYDATSVRDRGRLGTKDTPILESCIEEDRILVTQNAEDFRKLVGSVDVHPGLIVLSASSRELSWTEIEVALQHIEARATPDARSWMMNRVVEIEGATAIDFELPRWGGGQ